MVFPEFLYFKMPKECLRKHCSGWWFDVIFLMLSYVPLRLMSQSWITHLAGPLLWTFDRFPGLGMCLGSDMHDEQEPITTKFLTRWPVIRVSGVPHVWPQKWAQKPMIHHDSSFSPTNLVFWDKPVSEWIKSHYLCRRWTTAIPCYWSKIDADPQDDQPLV